MLTAQDIKEKTFEKAIFGGYDMSSVDDYLDQVSNDFSALSKEHSVLKGKMKVLVDKVEEYRGSEDALRLALLSAQRTSAEIESNAKAQSESLLAAAREKSEAMIAEATQTAEKLMRTAELETATQQARLVEAKRSTAKFVDNMRLLCNKQLDFFDSLGEMDFLSGIRDDASPVNDVTGDNASNIDDAVRSIENSVARASVEPDPKFDISPEMMQPSDGSSEPTRQYSFFKPAKDAAEYESGVDQLQVGVE